MRHSELEKYASDCQDAADELAYEMLKEHDEVSRMAIAQSFCNFNLFFVRSISPILIHNETLDFILKNSSEIKRRFTLKEMLALDFNVRDLKPFNFSDLKQKLT